MAMAKKVSKIKNSSADKIIVRGARVHNLKSIDVEIPRHKFVVVTGISGSGKSSLAFDTIYAEGQRRYIESLSSYARQFMGLQEKPDADYFSGLSPAIAIDQKTVSHNPRSTVGTITEVYDLLRLLFARVGVPHCPHCRREIEKQTLEQIIDKILALGEGKEVMFLAPVIKDRRGEHKKILQEINKAGFVQVRLDGDFYPIEEALDLAVDRAKPHTLEVVVKRLRIPNAERTRQYRKKVKELIARQLIQLVKIQAADEEADNFLKALETALDLGNGLVSVRLLENGNGSGKEYLFSQHFSCPTCGINLPNIEPNLFSFNSPHGACPTCKGLGITQEVDWELVVPNKKLTIAEGAIRPWVKLGTKGTAELMKAIESVGARHGFSTSTVLKDFNKEQLNILMHGEDEFEGVVNNLMAKYNETDSEYTKVEIEKYMRLAVCAQCAGKRLNPIALAVTMAGSNMAEVTNLNIEAATVFFKNLLEKKSKFKFSEREFIIAEQILREIYKRLTVLSQVGVNYLTLDRSANTLSGGEAQRIKLATQIGAGLTGVIYVLDEPSVGLHQRDNQKLIETLKNLRNLDNTVIVVEHDEQTIMAADYLIDVGPGAGKYGGEIVACGTPAEVKKNKDSLTGQYLSGHLKINLRSRSRKGNGKTLVIKKAGEFNLKNIDVKIPLGKFICVTGVSGSGKSTLVTEILAKALTHYFYSAKDLPGKHKDIVGLQYIDKVIDIDQSPIGRTPRSNPATYTGVFTLIRDLFTELPEAKIRRYEAGHFSFNVVGGRCEGCQGGGLVRIEMNFLPDVYVLCEECGGKRFRPEILQVHYQDKNIADVLEMTVEEAKVFFAKVPAIVSKLETLIDVGLGYVQLGQSATTLSGGEAQRVKLATELSRRATGKTLYILDEPTTGLHFADVEKLLNILHKLVDKGNTVLVIEHNLDVIKTADWVIDLGLEGGDEGGYLVAEGTPGQIAKTKKSYTGQYLKKFLKLKL